MSARQRPKGWEVEWISDLPMARDGEADWDRATYSYRDFPEEATAVAFAKQIAPKSCLGVAHVRDFTTDRYNQRDYGQVHAEYDGE